MTERSQRRENLMLGLLSPLEREEVIDAATLVPLPKQTRLMEPGQQKLENVYFPTTGVISYATVLDDGSAVETCTLGYDGIVGAEVALANQMLLNTETVVQIEGEAWMLTLDRFLDLLDRLPGLDAIARKHVQLMLVEAFQGVACNRMHPLEQRLSRWLLVCHDRSVGNDLPLTQEFIALLLGVQRPTVTIAVGPLQRAGLIGVSRGNIIVRDRRGLERASCECYESVQSKFLRLFGVQPHNDSSAAAGDVGSLLRGRG
jgi:CRP-like cAMP-binding protein